MFRVFEEVRPLELSGVLAVVFQAHSERAQEVGHERRRVDVPAADVTERGAVFGQLRGERGGVTCLVSHASWCSAAVELGGEDARVEVDIVLSAEDVMEVLGGAEQRDEMSRWTEMF